MGLSGMTLAASFGSSIVRRRNGRVSGPAEMHGQRPGLFGPGAADHDVKVKGIPL